MWSRPDVSLHAPKLLEPGASFDAEVVLDASAPIDVDGIDVTLRSLEVITLGKANPSHEHLRLGSTFAPRLLGAGRTTLSVRFALPPGLVPSYEGAMARIEHLVDVHVRVPWWLDRRATFLLHVASTHAAHGGKPIVYATHTDGPRGQELAIELSLESDTVSLGGTLAGAVAILNTAHHTIRRVMLQIVACERYGDALRDLQTLAVTLCEGPPAEGAPIPFRLTLPTHLRPSFAGRLFSHVWYARVVAELGFASDVVLAGRLTVGAATAPGGHAAYGGVLLPVGRERRSVVWTAAAAETGLHLREETQELLGEVGAVKVAVSWEHGAEGSHLVAHLAYDGLGLALDAHSKRWNDAFGPIEFDSGDPAFDRKISVRGRFPEQLAAVFDASLRAALLEFEEVHVGDAALGLSSSAGGSDERVLAGFARAALATARAIDAAAARVPPPPPMARAERAWRAYARARTARFEPGSMSVFGALHEDERIDVQTRWDGGTPVGTRLSCSVPEAERLDERLASASFREAVAELRARAPSLEVGPTRIELTVGASLDDPATVADLSDGLAVLTAMLRRGPPVGPYR